MRTHISVYVVSFFGVEQTNNTIALLAKVLQYDTMMPSGKILIHSVIKLISQNV